MTAVTSTETATAVDQFERRHDAHERGVGARRYRERIPLHRPAPGEQYAFEVDLDACTGCKACVTACHSLNGLEADESWRSVGLLHSLDLAAPTQQTVTTACHHCVEPPCLTGCPVDAYEKDAATGIVTHLDDQCIGCGYCTLTCPYEVPRLNAERGIVRKCDMCTGRLAVGEAPACVQGCPNGAIKITVVDMASAVRDAAAGRSLVPGSPSSAITVPTTVYITRRPEVAELRAADHFSLRPAQAHPPLAVMLVLTQLAVGAIGADYALWLTGSVVLPGPMRLLNAGAGLAMGALALGASVLHLGRPRYAFRAVIGVRHSWLSREIVAFAMFAALVPLYAVTRALAETGAGIPVVFGALALGAGVAGVGCSVMIYAVTRRTWWRAWVTGPKFGMTALACGLATVFTTSITSGVATTWLALSLAGVVTAKLTLEATVFRHLRAREPHDLKRTAMLLSRDLRRVTCWRFGLGATGGIVAPLTLTPTLATGARGPLMGAVALLALLALVAGELIERGQFFVAVTAPRMPGLSR